MCPAQPSVLPPIANLLTWSAGIAHRVARQSGATTSEREDLVSHAHVLTWELYQLLPGESLPGGTKTGFDVDLVPPGGEVVGAWRGWAYSTIYYDLIREVIRMRAGGMIKRASRRSIVVAALGETAESIADDEVAPVEREERDRPRVAPVGDGLWGRRLAHTTKRGRQRAIRPH